MNGLSTDIIMHDSDEETIIMSPISKRDIELLDDEQMDTDETAAEVAEPVVPIISSPAADTVPASNPRAVRRPALRPTPRTLHALPIHHIHPRCHIPLNYYAMYLNRCHHSYRPTDLYRVIDPSGRRVPVCFKCKRAGHVQKYCKR